MSDDRTGDDAPDTPGGEPVEPVEDRPSVGTTQPQAYPDRGAKSPIGAESTNDE